MLLPYQFYIGGTIGSGKQWLSWIHIDDVVRMMDFIIHKIDGPLNMTAPAPIRMKEFGKTIAVATRKPHWLPVPSFMLHALLGEMSILVLEGQHVLPIKAIKHGYQYTFPAIDHALQKYTFACVLLKQNFTWALLKLSFSRIRSITIQITFQLLSVTFLNFH